MNRARSSATRGGADALVRPAERTERVLRKAVGGQYVLSRTPDEGGWGSIGVRGPRGARGYIRARAARWNERPALCI